MQKYITIGPVRLTFGIVLLTDEQLRRREHRVSLPTDPEEGTQMSVEDCTTEDGLHARAINGSIEFKAGEEIICNIPGLEKGHAVVLAEAAEEEAAEAKKADAAATKATARRRKKDATDEKAATEE